MEASSAKVQSISLEYPSPKPQATAMKAEMRYVSLPDIHHFASIQSIMQYRVSTNPRSPTKCEV
jgi:hypothetical protein